MMNPQSPRQSSGAIDFRQARRQAAMQQIMSQVTGYSNQLLSFNEVYDQLKLEQSAHQERRKIPLDAIVGSAGRYNDFTRTFLPLQAEGEARWVRVRNLVCR